MSAKKSQKGAIIIIVFIMMVVILLLSTYFLSFSLWEKRISSSQQSANSAYYIAESGINEAIWKLKNDHSIGDGDSAWADDFIDEAKNPEGGPYWSSSFTHNFSNATYVVTIQNTQRGAGDIVSTARVPIGNGKYAQRIVKVAVFRALASPIGNRAMFTGGASGDMAISSSNISIFNGDLFSGNVFNISSSNLNVADNPDTEELEGQVFSHNNIIQSSTTINSTAICAKNICTQNCADYEEESESCPSASNDVPLVDFDSSEASSFKSRAQAAQNLNQCQILCNGSPCSTKCVLSPNEFSNLFKGVSSVTINSKITFVTGNIDISSKTLVVNGVLIGEQDANISSSNITINQPDVESPSGLLVERKINISSTVLNMTGIIYSCDQMNMSSSSGSITGAILARKIAFSTLSSLNITLNNDIILYGLGYIINGEPVIPTYSPVITIDHWEESY